MTFTVGALDGGQLIEAAPTTGSKAVRRYEKLIMMEALWMNLSISTKYGMKWSINIVPWATF